MEITIKLREGKNIKPQTELPALARQQKLEGKTDIAEFMVNRGTKIVSEVLDTAREMEHLTNDLKRARKSRVHRRLFWPVVSMHRRSIRKEWN